MLDTSAIGQANTAAPMIAAFHQANCSIVRAAMAMFTPEHLSRLTLVVAFLYDWLISAGAKSFGLAYSISLTEKIGAI